MATETRYAKSGDLHIAYRTLGTGPIDLVLIEQWFSNVEIERDVPPLARFNDRLAAFGRVILFDKRGVGLSDPVPMTAMPPIEEWMDDLRAVMDAVGSERAAVIAGMAGGFMASVFAATYPERTSSLVLCDSYARLHRAEDYPWGSAPEDPAGRLDTIELRWGGGAMLPMFAPELAHDVALRASWGRYERHSVSPGAARLMVPMIEAMDIRSVLPAIRVPTLVISRADGPISSGHGRYLASTSPAPRTWNCPVPAA